MAKNKETEGCKMANKILNEDIADYVYKTAKNYDEALKLYREMETKYNRVCREG